MNIDLIRFYMSDEFISKNKEYLDWVVLDSLRQIAYGAFLTVIWVSFGYLIRLI